MNLSSPHPFLLTFLISLHPYTLSSFLFSNIFFGRRIHTNSLNALPLEERKFNVRQHCKFIKFKLATLVFRCLHGTAPHYLSANFIRVADVPARRPLLSSTTNTLIVRPTRLVTFSDRAFPVAGGNLWNSHSDDITPGDWGSLYHVDRLH